MCKPKSGKGEQTINCQLITDPDILRLWVEVEATEFQCKIVYDRQEPLDGWWWDGKLALVKEWMEDFGCVDAFDAVALCLRKMEVPMLTKVAEGGSLASPRMLSEKPTEGFMKFVDVIEKEVRAGMMKPPPPAKKKRNEKDDTQTDLLGGFNG